MPKLQSFTEELMKLADGMPNDAVAQALHAVAARHRRRGAIGGAITGGIGGLLAGGQVSNAGALVGGLGGAGIGAGAGYLHNRFLNPVPLDSKFQSDLMAAQKQANDTKLANISKGRSGSPSIRAHNLVDHDKLDKSKKSLKKTASIPEMIGEGGLKVLKKVAPSAALMAAGAIGYDQTRKAYGDWQLGRAYRMNTQR